MTVEYGGSAPLRTVKPYIITVSAAGIVHLSPYSNELYVNEESLGEKVQAAIKRSPVEPVCNADKDFPARIYVVVELIGDTKPREEDEHGADALEEA